MIPCTNAWHDELDPDSIHCESCGMRSDGKTTLANMSLGLLGRLRIGGDITIRHQHTDETIVGPLEIRTGEFLAGNERGGRIIPVAEAFDWLLVDLN